MPKTTLPRRVAASAPRRRTTSTNEQLLTREEAARHLGVQSQTLAAWALRGTYDLKFLKLGRKVLYRRADLDAFLAARTFSNTAAAAEADRAAFASA